MITDNHAYSPEEIMAYLDAELTPEQMTAASQHLDQCLDCRILVADLRAVSQKLSGWQIETSSLRVPLRGRAPFWRSGWAVATAAALVVIFFGVTARFNSSPALRQVASPRLEQYASLQDAAPSAPPPVNLAVAPLTGPLIVRTANLRLVATNFENVRTQIERITQQHHGYIGQLELNSASGAARSLSASLRIPAAQLDAVKEQLKQLGRVQSESQSGEDVTQRSIDLDARLANLQVTETRLQQLLRDRAGKLSDVLEVEQAVDRTRGEIETAQAERKLLSGQIALSTLQLTVSEEYKAPIEASDGSVLTRLRNAVIDGYRNGINVIVDLLVVLFSIGPAVLLLAGLVLPALLWYLRRRRKAGVLDGFQT